MWWAELVEHVEVLQIRNALNTRKIQVALVYCCQIQELPKSLLTSKKDVHLGRCRLSFPWRLPLVCPFQVLHGLVWVSSVKVLDFIELLVELIERVTGRDSLYLLGASFGILVDVEQAF